MISISGGRNKAQKKNCHLRAREVRKLIPSQKAQRKCINSYVLKFRKNQFLKDKETHKIEKRLNSEKIWVVASNKIHEKIRKFRETHGFYFLKLKKKKISQRETSGNFKKVKILFFTKLKKNMSDGEQENSEKGQGKSFWSREA